MSAIRSAMKKSKVNKLWLFGAASCVLAVATASVATLRPAVSESLEVQHAANAGMVLEDARARHEIRATLAEGGMEPQSCGFHILSPPRPSTFSSSDLSGDVNGLWLFAPILTRSPSLHLSVLGRSKSTVFASSRRVVPNAAAVLQKFQGSGGWYVQATFSARGFEVLKSAHGPTSSSATYTDWYGVVHPQGGASTPMTATLVCNSVVLRPFSVTGLVDLPGPPTVLVADGLTVAEADQILDGY